MGYITADFTNVVYSMTTPVIVSETDSLRGLSSKLHQPYYEPKSMRTFNMTLFFILAHSIMAYGSTPYVLDDPGKNGGHIKSAQMTHSNVCVRLINSLYEPYQSLLSTSMSNRTVNLTGKHPQSTEPSR